MRYLQEMFGSHTTICDDLSTAEKFSIIQAYSLKFHPRGLDSPSMQTLISGSLSVSEKVFRFMINSHMGLEFLSYEEFLERYLTHPKPMEYFRKNSKLENIVSLVGTHGQTGAIPLKYFFGLIPVQHEIYGQIAVWVYAYFKPLWETCRYLYPMVKKTRLEGKAIVEGWKRLCM
jgi:hypothetical protein